MKSVIIAGLSLTLALAGADGEIARAQTTSENITATDGNASNLGTGNSSAAPGTVTRGSSGGAAILGPDGAYNVVEVAPPVISVTGDTGVLDAAPVMSVEPAYTEPVYEEPVYEEPIYDETATAPETTTVATETDLDADNLADDLEWELGLDPTIADVDGDGVADGDELSIYGTDPLAWDTDGDGLADGEELFGLQSDPLLWDDLSSEGVETAGPA